MRRGARVDRNRTASQRRPPDQPRDHLTRARAVTRIGSLRGGVRDHATCGRHLDAELRHTVGVHEQVLAAGRTGA
jgi:hypothetical protein